MKKMMSALGVCGALFLGACDSNAGAQNGDTASGFPLKLGSGRFVPGFEEQLIGATKGEERDVNITFPTQYVPELAGKDVVFKVKVVDIVKE